MRLIHITDPHLSNLNGLTFASVRGKRRSGYLTWRKKRQKKHLPAVLERLCACIQAEKADQILLTGDLIQIGMKAEIVQAKQWLEGLGSSDQVMLVPGNHDVYAAESGAAIEEFWAEYIFPGGDVCKFPVMKSLGDVCLIGLSSAIVSPLFMATGRLDTSQLDMLEQLLETAHRQAQMVCLLIHHPPLPGMTKWRKALSNARQLQAVLACFPPALIFHGHLHHNREFLWGDTRVFCTASASSVSDASYRVIDIEKQGNHWSMRMTLKSIAIEKRGELVFLTVDEQSWSTPVKYPD